MGLGFTATTIRLASDELAALKRVATARGRTPGSRVVTDLGSGNALRVVSDADIVGRAHAPYHVYLHLLFWTGCRPSEAAGLQWGDIDLDRATARIERSRHLYADDETKTVAARRTMELHPVSVELLRAMRPIRVEPDLPVFLNVDGGQLEPKAFSEHWYACLRARHPGARAVRRNEGHVRVADDDSQRASRVAGGTDRRRLDDAQTALRNDPSRARR